MGAQWPNGLVNDHSQCYNRLRLGGGGGGGGGGLGGATTEGLGETKLTVSLRASH